MNELLFSVLERASVGLIVLDAEQRVVLWNSWLTNFFGVSAKIALNKPIQQIFPNFEKEIYQQIIQDVLQRGQKRICSRALHPKLFDLQLDASKLEKYQLNAQFEPIIYMNQSYVLVQVLDVSAQHFKISKMRDFIKRLENIYESVREAEKKNRILAIHDPLTKLPNRILFNERLQSAFYLAKRNNQVFALMMVDIDGFKQINDTYGHYTGDRVLEGIASNLKKTLRKIDTVARIGGDEFAIILSQLTDEADVHIVADKILNAIRMTTVMDEQPFQITASVGITLYPRDGEDLDELLKLADDAMYQVKKAQKDGYHV